MALFVHDKAVQDRARRQFDVQKCRCQRLWDENTMVPGETDKICTLRCCPEDSGSHGLFLTQTLEESQRHGTREKKIYVIDDLRMGIHAQSDRRFMATEREVDLSCGGKCLAVREKGICGAIWDFLQELPKTVFAYVYGEMGEEQ